MDTDTLLTTTRSVRRKLDLDRPVGRAVLEDCLRIAQQAPIAGALAGALRWVVITDEATRALLAATTRETGLAAQAAYGHLVPARSLASGRHLIDVLERVPAYVLACMVGEPGADNAAWSAFYGSAYPAIWSLQLALRTRGLGSSIVNYHLGGREQDVARALDIPDGVTQIALLAVGYATTATFRPASRPDLAEVAYHERWGAPGA